MQKSGQTAGQCNNLYCSPQKMAGWALLVLFLSFVQWTGAHSPHESHWKGGAGMWHHISERLPVVSEWPEDDVSSASITVEPKVLEPGDTITVSWSDIQQAGENDTIFVYCPETASDSDYLDYQRVKVGEHEHGSMTFGPLVNMRCRYQFRYMAYHNSKSFTRLAASQPIGFVNGSGQPTQGRLSLVSLFFLASHLLDTLSRMPALVYV